MAANSLSRHPIYTALALGDYDCDQHYQVVRQRGSRNWLIFATIHGVGRIAHAEGRIACRPGTVVSIAPGVPHDYATDPQTERWVFVWAHFKPPTDWLPLLQWPEGLPGIRMLAPKSEQTFNRIVSVLRESLRHLEQSTPHARDWSRLRLHEALLECAQSNPLATGHGRDPRIQAVCDHLARHLDKSHTILSLANYAKLSVDRFAHRFRSEVGTSPINYLEELRMQAAVKWLAQPNLRVQQIARLVGFTNAGHFATRFRRWSGSSPREWREHHDMTSGPG